MKKSIFAGLFAGLLLISCGGENEGGSSESFNVADVKDACDCADGAVLLASEVLEIMGDKTEEDAEEDKELEAKIEPLMDKLDDLEDKCRHELNVKVSEMMECNDKVAEIFEKMEEKF